MTAPGLGSGNSATVFTAIQNAQWRATGQLNAPGTPPFVTGHDPQAFFRTTSSATQLWIEAEPFDVDHNTVGVWVNGVFNQTLTYAGPFGVPQQLAVTLPAGAGKTVDFCELAAITGIFGTATVQPAPSYARTLVWYGDSIPTGFNAVPKFLSGPMIVRYSGRFDNCIPYSLSGLTLNADANSPAKQAALAAQLVARSTGTTEKKILWEIGTNDWSLATSNAATWAGWCAGTFDAIHATDPTIGIYAETLLSRAGEATPNLNGEFCSDYRAALTAVQAARSSFVTLVPGPPLISLVNISGVHPTNAGHAEWAANLLAGWLS